MARHYFKKDIRNLVFMGMGEPFDNFDNVMKAILVLNDQRGFDIALRHMTVSTSGRVDGISKLGHLGLKKLNLAISLNAPNDKIRSDLMPLNNRYSMADLKYTLKSFPMGKKDEFFIEYVLIKGVNDLKET